MKKRTTLKASKKGTAISLSNVAGLPDEGVLLITQGSTEELVDFKFRYRKKTLWEFVKGVVMRLDFSREVRTTTIDSMRYRNRRI